MTTLKAHQELCGFHYVGKPCAICIHLEKSPNAQDGSRLAGSGRNLGQSSRREGTEQSGTGGNLLGSTAKLARRMKDASEDIDRQREAK